MSCELKHTHTHSSSSRSTHITGSDGCLLYTTMCCTICASALSTIVIVPTMPNQTSRTLSYATDAHQHSHRQRQIHTNTETKYTQRLVQNIPSYDSILFDNAKRQIQVRCRPLKQKKNRILVHAQVRFS